MGEGPASFTKECSNSWTELHSHHLLILRFPRFHADIQDFRRCSNLITSIAPGRGAPRVEALTAKNVQRGLAQKVQEASAQFRKKQKVYMQSE